MFPCHYIARLDINVSTTQLELESKLNDFALPVRSAALSRLNALAQSNALDVHPDIAAVNMHAHTFFSFNAYGHSPTSLAWLAKKNGYTAIGSVDFDVLDAVDEFLDACESIHVRGSTAIETRVYIPEFSTREISSPGEPGVAYHMGIGFASSQASGISEHILRNMRERASQRNRDLVERVNQHLSPVTIDYDRDVLPLTPAGNATERHILVAYTSAVEKSGIDPVAYWTEKLGADQANLSAIVHDLPKLHNLIRAKLMKRGGIGYVQPGPATFPSVEEFHQFVVGCQALPCATWLDGTSKGEQAIEELLNLLIEKGVVALNIIPDRNWNIVDPVQKATKVKNLYDVVRLATALDLPLNIGTEMNTYGQKLIDDFESVELSPVRKDFLNGAHFVFGHTMMQRALGLGYQSDWAKTQLRTRKERNAFYTQLGYDILPGQAGIASLRRLSPALSPAQILAVFD